MQNQSLESTGYISCEDASLCYGVRHSISMACYMYIMYPSSIVLCMEIKGLCHCLHQLIIYRGQTGAFDTYSFLSNQMYSEVKTGMKR